MYEDGRRRINATEMDASRRSARFCKLGRKMKECIREKMNAQDTILDEITRNNSFGVVMSREWTERDYQKL